MILKEFGNRNLWRENTAFKYQQERTLVRLVKFKSFLRL